MVAKVLGRKYQCIRVNKPQAIGRKKKTSCLKEEREVRKFFWLGRGKSDW
jgi:hypothetical protein